MKKILLFAALFLHYSAYAQSVDENAIKSLIARESDATFASNWEAWSGCWAHEKYVCRTENAGTGYQEMIGWEALEKKMRAAFIEDPLPWAVHARRENWNLHIKGKIAFATFSQTVTEDASLVAFTTSETRTCEKTGRGWKIIHAGTLRNYANYYAISMLVRGISYAESKGETPESYANIIFAWTQKHTGHEPRTLLQFSTWMQEWRDRFQLDAEVIKSTSDLIQIRRANLGKDSALAGFFQSWGDKGADLERYYREHWKLDAASNGFSFEATDDGDKTLETVRKK